MSALADMDAEKKVAVLKKAILALTKQKQDVEASRSALEEKVASLMTELGKAEERNTALLAKNRELAAEVERLQHGAAGLAAVPGAAAARSLLGTLGSLGTSLNNNNAANSHSNSSSSKHDVDQQRLFEENEALHIQLFEQRSAFEKRLRLLEADKAQQAMRVHSLEGLVASAQAADVATSQQVLEARRELAIEKGYTALCQYALLRGLVVPPPSGGDHDHHGGGGAADVALLEVVTPAQSEHLMSVLSQIVRRCCEVLQHTLSGVSALLPHTLPTASALGGTGSSSGCGSGAHSYGYSMMGSGGQAVQRQRTLIAAHREYRNKLNALCTSLLRVIEKGGGGDGEAEAEAEARASDHPSARGRGDADDGACGIEALEGAGKEAALVDLFNTLLGEAAAWFYLLHTNAGLLLGPLEPLHSQRCRAMLGGNSNSNNSNNSGGAAVITLEQQFQAVVASVMGEVRVMRDCLRVAMGMGMGMGTGEGQAHAVPLLALRLLSAMFCYRWECARAASASHGGKLSFERLLYNIEAAANYCTNASTNGAGNNGAGNGGGSNSSPLPTHYHVPLTHLIAAVKEGSRQWASAFGTLSVPIFPSSSSSSSSSLSSAPAAPHRRGEEGVGLGRPNGTLAKAMALHFASTCTTLPAPTPIMSTASGDEAHGKEGREQLATTAENNSVNNTTINTKRHNTAAAAVVNLASAVAVAAPILASAEAEMVAQLRAADANALHCYTVSQRAMLELAHCHDRIEQLSARNAVVEGDNQRMRREYASVVEVYESQIRLLSDHLAELAQEGSVATNGKKR